LNELSDLLHNNNLIISVNLPASDDNFKYADISKVVDYTILMAYDEHWASSSAGPIASIDWYNNILETRSKDVPSEKMIIALGNYAYDWTDGKQEGNVLTYEESIIVAKESQ
jgi:spore germination protein YaaH